MIFCLAHPAISWAFYQKKKDVRLFVIIVVVEKTQRKNSALPSSNPVNIMTKTPSTPGYNNNTLMTGNAFALSRKARQYIWISLLAPTCQLFVPLHCVVPMSVTMSSNGHFHHCNYYEFITWWRGSCHFSVLVLNLYPIFFFPPVVKNLEVVGLMLLPIHSKNNPSFPGKGVHTFTIN